MSERAEPARGLTVIRDGDAVPDALRGAVVAIGNFDGMHRGHQRLIRRAVDEAGRRGAPAAALTFDPHPRRFFAPDAPFFPLTPDPLRFRLLERFGMDGIFVLRFDEALADLSARDFFERLIRHRFGASALVIGSNFHFGRGREGSPALLRDLTAGAAIGLLVEPPVEQGDVPVSSSRIRAALGRGEITEANELLGYRWFVTGTVQPGDKRGRTLGYPTANMRLADGVELLHGIYAVRAAIAPGTILEGVASFGRRPTFDNGAPLLESFFFDFDGDLYGSELSVEVLGLIRPEERFDSAEALVRRMHEDERIAREIVGREAQIAEPSLIG